VLRNGRRHQVELNLDALRRIGLQPTLAQRRVHIVAGDAAEREVAQRLQHVGLAAKSFVHLHPASRWQFKCWSAEKNAQLIDQLVARGERVLITAAPDATEQAFVETILARTQSPVINWAGTLSIKQLVALVAQAKVSVCVDSMPLHVASATSTPVVALFGPSGDQEWGPWMVPHAVVTSDHTCRPCGQDGCGGGKVSDCLEQLDVARVMRAVSRLIDTP
jgi:heptosyltransferase-3